MEKSFDIAVLGAGPGGYVAALKAARMGARVALVEKGHLGGTCLNAGCIPSKALLASAELFQQIRHAAEMGLDVDGTVRVNWAKIQARKDKVVQTLRTGIQGLLGARRVTIVSGLARLDGPGRLAVTMDGRPAMPISAGRIILAVGSVPSRLPGWPDDPQAVCTSDEALHWKTLPDRLLIVGGGVIGCEFACMMRAIGVEVTLVEMLPHLLPGADEQIAETLTRVFRERGITVVTGATIDDLALRQGAVTATLADGRRIETDRVLMATGRTPATADIGLERVGLTTDRGFLRVDDQMRTPVADHYCIGDANGRCLLAHAASAQGEVAAENAMGRPRSFDAPIPTCIYTFPEIAGVGMTAGQASAQGWPVATGTFPLRYLGKAMASRHTDGFVKVVRQRETGQLVGVHMIGHHATECIAAAAGLLHQKVTVRDMAEIVFAHPTFSEALKEAADDALFDGLHAPPRKLLRAMAEV